MIFKRIKHLEEEVKKLRDIIDRMPDLVYCEVCGCAIKRSEAIRGKPVVREKEIWYYFSEQYYIHYPYYCKAHAPKKRRRNEKR